MTAKCVLTACCPWCLRLRRHRGLLRPLIGKGKCRAIGHYGGRVAERIRASTHRHHAGQLFCVPNDAGNAGLTCWPGEIGEPRPMSRTASACPEDPARCGKCTTFTGNAPWPWRRERGRSPLPTRPIRGGLAHGSQGSCWPPGQRDSVALRISFLGRPGPGDSSETRRTDNSLCVMCDRSTRRICNATLERPASRESR